MANLQNLERTVVIAVVGFFSLIFTIILLCFCLFTVYNCSYKRMAQNYLKRMESETQTTDVENNSSLQGYDEILNGRHNWLGSLDCQCPHECFPFQYIEQCSNVFIRSVFWLTIYHQCWSVWQAQKITDVATWTIKTDYSITFYR